MTNTNDNDDRGIVNPKRRTLLLVMGSVGLAGCADTKTTGEQTDGTVTVEKDSAETVPPEEIGQNNDGTQQQDDEQKLTEQTEDEQDKEKQNEEEQNEEEQDEEKEDDDIEVDEETDEESTSDDEGDEEWSVDKIVERHTNAVAEVSYTADITLQGEDSSSDVENHLIYEERQVADSREITIQQESTADNGVSYVKHMFGMSGDDVEVEFDDGDTASGQLYDGEDPNSSPVVITGGGLLRELVDGVSLSATRLPEDQSGTTGEYEIVGHDSLNVTSGELVINQSNMVEVFKIDWKDSDGVPRSVDIDITELY